MTIPAIVVEQPGRTQVHITAPLTGVITKIHVVAGEAIEPGSPMFEIRLTHEELVTAQKEYLQTAESLDVVNREIARLKSLGEGVIAGKRILEQEYEKQKFEASLRATEQALLLHGLSEEQVQEIFKTRKLLNSLTIRAPDHSHTRRQLRRITGSTCRACRYHLASRSSGTGALRLGRSLRVVRRRSGLRGRCSSTAAGDSRRLECRGISNGR